MSEDVDVEEMRKGSRIDSAVNDSEENEDPLKAAIVDAFDAIEDGERSKTLSVRDGQLAALVHGVEADDRLDEVGEAFANELDREPADEYDRSEVLRLALRYAFHDVTGDVVETATEAQAEHVADQF